MNDSRHNDTDDRSWVERLTHFISGTPQSRSDLEGVLSLAAENEIIDEDAKTIMEGAMSVSDMQVRDIMIPRAQMVVIKIDTDIEEALPQIVHAGHSRYPVIDDNPDNVVGILLAKDLLPLIVNRDSEFDLRALMRPAVVVPESKRLNVLLREFRQNRNHMAIVIDEYGGVAGLVTIEDVLEEIVGEIEDETDTTEGRNIRKISDSDYFVQAQTLIEDLDDKLDEKEAVVAKSNVIDVAVEYRERRQALWFCVDSILSLTIKETQRQLSRSVTEWEECFAKLEQSWGFLVPRCEANVEVSKCWDK